MMKPWYPIALAGLTTAGTLTSLPVLAARLSDGQAALLLERAVQRDTGYAVPGGATCLQLVLEASGKRFVELALREKSEPPCQGGDGLQSPVLDRFRISRAKGTIERQGSAGVYVPYADSTQRKT